MSSGAKQHLLKDNNNWFWWPLFPLYPYGSKNTTFSELVPDLVWSFEQLQGLYYVAVPIRMTVVKVPGGLMIVNPLPPTKDLVDQLRILEKKHGRVRTIVLPTASGLEHKISMPAMARSFQKAILWVCPGQWSFPFNLPLSWLGFPSSRTRILFADGIPHRTTCKWISLGPIDIGLGRFQEVACFHKPSHALLVTDALVGIRSQPPELFDLDPTPLLFHARDEGSQPLKDSPELRRKGWKRLVLFASFLKPSPLQIPSINKVLENSFKSGLRNWKSHFGIYPFEWQKGWDLSVDQIMGRTKPLLQVAPVIEKLVFPRAKKEFLRWLDEIKELEGMKLLVPAHFSAPIIFTKRECISLRKKINFSRWGNYSEELSFLGSLDKSLLKLGVVPNDPLNKFKD